jgi:hypothetical protein
MDENAFLKPEKMLKRMEKNAEQGCNLVWRTKS